MPRSINERNRSSGWFSPEPLPSEEQPSEETLARRLEREPLTLAGVLKVATAVAKNLRDLHAAGYAHGDVRPGTIVLSGAKVFLLAPESATHEAGLRPCETCMRADIGGLGTTLRNMLLRARAAGEPPGGIFSGATALAEKFLARSSEPVLTMQNVVTELRLLGLQMRQSSASEAPKRREPALMPIRVAETRPAAALPPHAEFLSHAEPRFDASGAHGSRCPKCGGYFVHESRPRTIVEHALNGLGAPARRCRRCQYRFVRVSGILIARPLPSRRRPAPHDAPEEEPAANSLP